jgi:hypothetical protein
MHKSIPIVFALVALFILSLCSGCATQSEPNQTYQANGGFAMVSEGSSFISFDVAHTKLLNYRPDPENESIDVKTVYYIHGTNVDDSGNASGWIFGVRHTGKTELLAYDRSGWKKIPWSAPYGLEEIDLDRIVSPGMLFNRNTGAILGNPSQTIPDRRDLELMQGIYTLTISGSKDRILTFNATTGELIR